MASTRDIPRVRLRQRLSIAQLQDRWTWTRFPLILFMFTRITLLGFSQISLMLAPELWQNYRARSYLQHYPALDGLCRFDCEWFALIAQNGYWSAKATNFFPLFPFLGRVLHSITGLHFLVTLLIVANLAGLTAYLVIYQLFTQLANESAARWGLMLFAAYPFAFFQATAYPESLMICCSALAIQLALRGKHITAGVVLGLGVLARHLTMFAGAGLLAAQIRQRGLYPKRFLLSPHILGLLIPWTFLGLYSWYQYITFGNFLAFWDVRAEWGPRAWWGVAHLLTTKSIDADVLAMYTYLPFALLPTVGAIALARHRQWIELAAFALIFMLVLWSIGIWGIGRYSASCWPAFLPLGVWLSKHPNVQGPIIGLCAMFQGLFFFLYSHQFPIL